MASKGSVIASAVLVVATLAGTGSVRAKLAGDVSEIKPADRAILSKLLSDVGLDGAKVASVERTPERQARVMYDLAKKDLEAAKEMYCDAGDAVLERFKPDASRDANLRVMVEELMDQLPRARELGCLNHIKNDEVYAVDIDVEEVPEAKREKLIEAAKALVKAKKIERFLFPPRDPDAFHFEFKR